MIVYGLVATVGCLALWYRLEYWKGETNLVIDAIQNLDEKKEAVEKHCDFLKETILKHMSRPAYVTMSQEQLEIVSQLVAEKLKEPKWLN